MSKKSKRKTSLKSSILVLLLIAILLIASTYAWFTANTTVTVSTLNVKVEAQNGIQISADGINWKTVLTNEDITPGDTLNGNYSSNVNQIPATMEPVSTIGTVTNGKMDMYYGIVESDSTTGAMTLKTAETKETDTRGTTGKYIVFDMFLRVDAAQTKLILNDTSNVIAKSGTTDKGLKNAARVGFVVSNSIDSGAAAADIQALVPATKYIWEPNYDVHTSTGIAAASSIYSKSTTAGPGAAQLTYDGVKAVIPTPIPLGATSSNQSTYLGAVVPEYKTAADTGTDGKNGSGPIDVFGLGQGITKVRVYMWVEGQDVDCENNASGSDISYNLQFSIPTT